MKKIYPILIFVAGIFTLSFLYSFSIGFAKEKTIGITQAPGDWDVDNDGVKETCKKCHNTTNYKPELDVFVTDANNHNILGYDPGASYKIHVKVNATTNSPSGYGFQLVGLIDATASAESHGMQNYPGFSANVQEIDGILGRKYFEHKGVSTSNEFTIDWIAPNNGTGSVSFYVVGNAVNKDGNQGADSGTDGKIFTLSEGLLLANQVPITIANVRIMGNPSVDNIQLVVDAKKAADATISLFDLSGQQLISSKAQFIAGANPVQLDASHLKQGAYVLSIKTKYGPITKKVLLMH